MRGQGLMQAIARVNRVWRDKPGGLVVDYIGIGEELKQAIAHYTRASGGKHGEPVWFRFSAEFAHTESDSGSHCRRGRIRTRHSSG